MKLRSVAAVSLALLIGTGLGVGLQKYWNLSTKTANVLRRVGLYSYFYKPIEALAGSEQQSAIDGRLQGRLDLYVLVGQSNMVGAAPIPDAFKTSANIFTFGNNYQWERGTEPVDNPEGQIDAVSKDPEGGFGPAFTFAKTLVLEDSNRLIGLIPCARNGASITEWQQSLSDQTLYGSCLKRVRAASPMGEVKGILFFQGEADTIDPEQFPALKPDAEAWAEKFALFAYSFRQDIGQPNLPLAYAQIGQPENLEGLPNWTLVQTQQANIQIPNATMIETKDLPMDGIHYTVDSYEVIGQRFADAMTGLQAAQKAENPELENPEGESPELENLEGESPVPESVQ